jgi:hypothetical protein
MAAFIAHHRSTTQVEFLRAWRGYSAGDRRGLAVGLADQLVRLKIVRRLSDHLPSELRPAPGPASEPEVTREPVSQGRTSGSSVKPKSKKKRGKGKRGNGG